VLLIAGSGPTDRNGNNALLPVPIDNLRLLAEALATRGVASLRYDKRGLGASAYPGLSEEALRFDDLVHDAVLLAQLLADDARIRRVALAGHSEGALIATLAAASAPVQAVVSIAGAGFRASDLIRQQLADKLPQDSADAAQQALAALERGERLEDVPDELILLFRPSVQPYLISWFREDPAEAIARLQQPVLIVQGARDAQVDVAQAQRLHAAQPQARLRVMEGMDHLLALDGNIAAGAKQVATEMADWLAELEIGEMA
jgi:alpha-beta hydrolase superfamily lysophospholipase